MKMQLKFRDRYEFVLNLIFMIAKSSFQLSNDLNSVITALNF